MDAHGELPFRARLAHWIEHLAHVLPAQAPIRDFVHHNTLHGFQHLPFPEALAAAHRLSGASPYWPEARFQAEFSAVRIGRDDVLAALDDLGMPGLDDVLAGITRREVLVAALLAGEAVPSAARRVWCQAEQGDDAVADARHARALLVAGAAVDSPWQDLAAARWQALSSELGRGVSLRAVLQRLSGEDIFERARSVLQRHLAAHLDQGFAAWRNPAREQGFFAAWKAAAANDMAWELEELPGVHDEIQHLPDDPLAVLEQSLEELAADRSTWLGHVQRLALEWSGWMGMTLRRASYPQGDVPVSLGDLLAVRAFLEVQLGKELIRRLTGAPLGSEELIAYYAACPAEFLVREALFAGRLPEALAAEAASLCAAAQEGREVLGWEALAPAVAAHLDSDAQDIAAWRLAAIARQLGREVTSLDEAQAREWLAAAASLDTLTRGQWWLSAYEHHYREQLFGALAANQKIEHPAPPPSAQVVMCMDDREEGTRRHLEEIAPDVQTFGAAGFFGVVMYWRGLDDAADTALCPVVVTPAHRVQEVPVDGQARLAERRAGRREFRLRWRERLYQQTRRHWLAGPVLGALAAVPAVLALTASSLAPAWFGTTARRWQQQFDGDVQTRVAASAGLDAAAGFSLEEQVERVAAFLRMIGLTGHFAPLVLMLGHGSGSRNNPHLSAYDCGACSGRHGGPNARVFAALANRDQVRVGLRARGIDIPDGTWFIAAEHNTCDDGIEWYDLAQVPGALQSALDRLVGQLAEACRLHAVERCRRLASAPVRPTPWQARRHVAGRAADLAQARPELGHATNAAALIGRRSMSRGLFLDRRVFLISYDPTQDADGSIVESILLAAGPVGAGIALEYYFSTVDNERFGCGSKVTHNLTGLFGVMEGADSDLRTGLPWQMVEIHEPMRLLVVVEQSPEMLAGILARQPALQELVGNAWITLGSCDPASGALARYCPRRGWLPWSGRAVLPRVARSADWFAGESEPLPPAILLGN